MAKVVSLYRYPVKGMTPEPLESVTLETDGHFPGDRMFAIENGPSGFDLDAPAHLPKIMFLMLMRNERLASFRSRFDDDTATLTISKDDEALASGDVRTRKGQAALEAFFAKSFAYEMRGEPGFLAAPKGHRFVDSRSGFVSIIDLGSVEAIAKAAERASLDPLRFRANIYVEGLGAWGEFDLVGKRISIGGATLEITKRTDRCAATEVDPATGIRDLAMVKLLERAFGHHDCGVYARVISGGTVARGDELGVVDGAGA